MTTRGSGYAFHLALLLGGIGIASFPPGCSCDGEGSKDAPAATLTILAPQMGDTLGRADDLALDLPGLQVDVLVQTTNMQSGKTLQLTVAGQTQVASAAVRSDGTATFTMVSLPPGDAVSLVVTGPGGSRDEITVRVNLEIPRLSFLLPLQGVQLRAADDVDPAQEGLQFDVVVRGEWLPAGTMVRLDYDPARPYLELPLGEDGRVTYSAVTLPPGLAVTLSASAQSGSDLAIAEVTVSVEQPAPPPVIAFTEPLDGQTLLAADDLDGDLLNGVQVDVTLQTTNVDNNQEVELYVGGVRYPASAPVVNGTAAFTGVTLPESPPEFGGLELTATVRNIAGTEASDAITVFVSTGACVVQLEPLPGGQGCDVLADPIPATPEVEVDFQVRTSCSRVSLVLNRVVVAEVELDEGFDTAIFHGVGLLQGENLLYAEAEGSGGRRGASQELTYVVDTIRPTLGFAEIAGPGQEPTLFSLADDLYRDRPGLQIDLQGWVTDLAPGSALTLSVTGPDGQPVEDLPAVFVRDLVDGQGRYTFLVSALTFPQSGSYRLALSALDLCDQPGSSDEYTVRVLIDQPTLAITQPADDAVLLARDDRDLLLPGYQTEFVVEAEHVPAGDPIEVRCGPRALHRRSVVGTALVPAGGAGMVQVTVPVTLEDGELACYAAYQGVNPATSAELRLLVAGLQPSIVITSPQAARVRTATVNVAVTTANVEDGQEVTLTLNQVVYAQRMVVRTGGASLANVPLEQGPNVLQVDVQDRAGNPAQAATTVIRDDVAPVVQILSPVDGATLYIADDLDADPENGVQVDVVAQVDGVVDEELATACLSDNGVVLLPCPASPLPVVGGQVTFPAVDLIPGSNVLSVEVTDGAGNVGTAQAAILLEVDAPAIEILPVGPDNCLASGQAVSVSVQTSAADGSVAKLSVDGQVAAQAEVIGGQAAFVVDLLPDHRSLLVARVDEPGRYPGFSLPVQVRVYTQPGELTFVEPSDGATINLDNPSTGGPDYVTTVRLVSSGLEAGQQVDMTVSCDDQPPAAYMAEVGVAGENGLADVIFTEVSLPDEATCTLAATTTGCSGLVAEVQITIHIDRVPPSLSFVFPTDGQSLTFQNDVDPLTPGLQIDVLVRAGGVPQGTEVSLQVDGSGDFVVARTEAQGLTYFNGTTITDGIDVPLEVEVADPAGNVATAMIVLREVIGAQPSVAFFSPAADTSWRAADDLDPNTPGFQQDFVFVTANLADGTTLRLCSDNGAAAGADCGRVGFKEVGSAQIQGNTVRVRRATLAQGTHHLYGEARYGINSRAESGIRNLLIDTTLPRLLELAATGDVPPLGVLNASEDATPGGPTLEIRVEGVFADDPADPFDEIGENSRVILFTNNPAPMTQLASARVTGNRVTFPTVHMREGTHRLSVQANDAVGNPLPPGSPQVVELVDITAPGLSFVSPLDGQMLNGLDDLDPAAEGLQLDVELLCSGAEAGRPLVLTIDGVEGPSLPSRDGLMTFERVTLPEGDVLLSATLSDAAGNPAQASARVVSDPTPPVVTVLQPTAGASFGVDDDVDPERGGYQIDVQVQVTGADEGAAVRINSSISGQVNAPAAIGPDGTAVVRCTVPPGDQQIVARVTDAHGNVGVSAAVDIHVAVVGCGIYFAAPQGTPALLGLQDDLDGDARNGAQVDVLLNVADPACNGQQLELLRDGTVWASTVVADGQAVFSARTFEDATEVVLLGRIQQWSGPELRVLTDLVPPSGSFSRPAADPAVLLAADDLAPGTAGLQYEFRLERTGTGGGSLVLSSSIDGELARLPSALQPQPLGAGLITLPAARTKPLSSGTHELTATIADAAGNIASFGIQAEVDVKPPDMGALTATVLDGRLPLIRLSWAAPSDDGDGVAPVAGYQIRYSAQAIDAANFDAACPVETELTGAQPGELQEAEVAGPGPDGACRLRLEGSYHFAVAAIDRLGNRSVPATAGPLTIELTPVPVAVNSQAFGSFVTALGDVNDDSYPDLGVSSMLDGKAWIVFGRADLEDWTVAEVTPPHPVPAAFGYRMAGLGDVSGDGIADFAVTGQGGAWLYLGRAGDVGGAPPVATLAVAAASYATVSAAGNFDGAGPRDLVVGDFSVSGNRGAAWIVLGRSAEDWAALGGLLTLGFDRAQNDALQVIAYNAAAGDSAAALGSFCNEDGKDDVALAGYRVSASRGQVAILCGRSLAEMPAGRNLDSQDATVLPTPDAREGWFGWWISGGTDLTGDGKPDMVVSAPKIKSMYVYPGGAEGVPQPQATLVGAGLEYYGWAQAQIGDLDGNGLDDLLVATNPTPAQNEPGGLAAVYLNQLVDGQVGFGTRDPVYRGASGSQFGYWVAAPGDMNGDGAPDLAIGSPGTQQVFLYH